MSYGNTGDPTQFFLPTNPFLALVEEGHNLMDVDPDAAAAEREARNPFQQAQPAVTPRFNFKLPEFWPHAPAMWFARAQFRMEVAGISAERDMFAYTVDALPYESLRLVHDLLMAPPAVRPFSILKERLLLATQLTPVQMADRLMKMPDLGDRRLSQMLAAMLEFRPPGEEATAFFRAAYLSRLPADIRGHLDGLESGDLKDLAARADRQWANGRGAIAPVAAVDLGSSTSGGDEASDPVAAVAAGNRGKSKFFFQKKRGAASGGGGGGSGSAGGAGGGHKKSGWSKLTQLTICQRHLQFGEDAHACGDPATCQWSKLGN